MIKLIIDFIHTLYFTSGSLLIAALLAGTEIYSDKLEEIISFLFIVFLISAFFNLILEIGNELRYHE